MKPFSLNQIAITDGFWAEKQRINAEITVKSVYERFAETGRFAALKCSKEPHEAHVFWDSDAAKWLEGAAYLLSRKEDAAIRAWYEESVQDILANQCENGYYNSFFQVKAPEKIFTERPSHELYCAGHLFEAAVAAKQYLNDDRLLGFASRYVDYITERFMVKRDATFVTPGHQEIELALFRLYELTGEEKYRVLGQFFLDERGKKVEQSYDFAESTYSQSHLPVREQRETHGHAVRLLYLMIAMADSARLTGEKEMKEAVEGMFQNIVTSKMYVTGGVGSTHAAERVSVPYDLPNDTAYSETCASIALVLFCDRMLRLTGEAVYGDVLERALYNGVMAGLSLSGDGFFYVNPLEMDLTKTKYNLERWGINREYAAITQRVKVFDCSCCPPNVIRFIEQIPSFIWYADEQKGELMLSQPITSTLNSSFADCEVQANLPVDGKVSVKVNSHGKPITLKIRKPAWCGVALGGEENGYIVRRGVFNGEELTFDFAPTVQKVFANPKVRENAGKVAFTYGPTVFAAEGVDNDVNLFAARIEKDCKTEIISRENGDLGLKLQVSAKLLAAEDLYSTTRPQGEAITLTLVPYRAWANRGENDMIVWMPEA